MFKFREPTFVEYLLYDVERFSEKGRREQITICLHFLEGTPSMESFALSDADKLIHQFSDFITGASKILSMRR